MAGKLFLGGISPSTTKESIVDYFGQFGDITDAVAMMQNGRPRGFGFVTFEDPQVADHVLQSAHELDGQNIEVKSAVPRGQEDFMGQPQQQYHQPAQPAYQHKPSKGGGGQRTDKVFVGGLSPTISEEEFRDYFAKYGNLIDVVVMKDKVTGKPKGFGFVQYDDTEAVELIMQDYETHQMAGKWIEVKRAVPKDRMSGPPMGHNGMGKGGGGKGGGFAGHAAPARGGGAGFYQFQAAMAGMGGMPMMPMGMGGMGMGMPMAGMGRPWSPAMAPWNNAPPIGGGGGKAYGGGCKGGGGGGGKGAYRASPYMR